MDLPLLVWSFVILPLVCFEAYVHQNSYKTNFMIFFIEWHFEWYHLPHHTESSCKKMLSSWEWGNYSHERRQYFKSFETSKNTGFKNTHFFFLFYHCFSHLEFYNKILALLFYKHFFQMFCFLMYMFLNILNFTILLLLWGYLLIHIYGVRQQNILKLLITHF